MGTDIYLLTGLFTAAPVSLIRILLLYLQYKHVTATADGRQSELQEQVTNWHTVIVALPQNKE